MVKVFTKKILARVTKEEHRELKSRAHSRQQSLSRYLVESALTSPGNHRPSPAVLPDPVSPAPANRSGAGYPIALTTRFAPDEHKELVHRARSAGLSLSRFLIERGLADQPKPLPPPVSPHSERGLTVYEQLDEAVYQLSAVGKNLNQLTHRAHVFHATNQTIPPTELLKLLDHVLAKVKKLESATAPFRGFTKPRRPNGSR